MSNMDRIETAINNLIINENEAIKSRIEEVRYCIDIPETNSKGYCYCLKVDANGRLRLQDLIEYIDFRIVDYAIPKKEIDEAKNDLNNTGSTRKIIQLRKKAENLFTDLDKTGEGGEILLYILTQDILKLPQLISKMSLKTSAKMHYQGADGVHFRYNRTTGNLELYWAEAKIHQNINDETVEDILVEYFDKDKEQSNHLVYKGVCFIGFDYDKYPSDTDITKTTEHIKNAILTEYEKWHSTIGEKIKDHENLDKKEIHVFLMPFPSVDEFRKCYLKTIK